MDADEAINIKYSAKFAQSSNYWKYSIGQNKGIKAQQLIEKKHDFEIDLQAKIDTTSGLKQEYGDLLKQINYYYNNSRRAESVSDYLDEAIFGGPDIIISAYNVVDLYTDMIQGAKKDSIKQKASKLKERMDKYFKDFNLNVDKEVLVSMFNIYSTKVNKNLQADIFSNIETKYNNDIQKYADELYATSIFADQAKMNKFLKKPKVITLTNDMGFNLMLSFLSNYRGIYLQTQQLYQKMDSLNRIYVELTVKLNPQKNFYPDANSTMRLSYGKVQSYAPADGMRYKYYTTLKGVMDKEDPNNPEFYVEPKLKQLYEAKDYGQYADKDGTMHVCFITNNDITGGNSGSPVLNGNGELTGLAFDGNWEAMSSDLEYIPDLQRTIIVDVRYVLFIIDKFAGAQNLIDELKLN
jgi:hypothetical protein